MFFDIRYNYQYNRNPSDIVDISLELMYSSRHTSPNTISVFGVDLVYRTTYILLDYRTLVPEGAVS